MTSAVTRQNTVVECRGLTFGYKDSELFNNLSFEVSCNGFYSLVGKSGIGKTSLARIIEGELHGWSADRLVVPEQILYAHDQERLPVWQTVGEHYRQVAREYHWDEITQIAEAFELDDEILQKPGRKLSSGQLDRVNLIRYLSQSWDLLILDEALANVDEITRYTILSTVKELLDPGTTLIYITHHLVEAIAFSKKIILLCENERVNTRLIDGLDLNHFCPNDISQTKETFSRIIEAA